MLNRAVSVGDGPKKKVIRGAEVLLLQSLRHRPHDDNMRWPLIGPLLLAPKDALLEYS